MELCFNAYNHSPLHGLPVDMARVCAATRDAGFDLIGLDRFMVDAYRAEGGTLPELRRLLDDHGLRCFEVLGAVVDDSDERSLAGAAQLAELVEALEAQFVLMVVDAPLGDETTERFGRCAGLVAEAGGKVGLECAVRRASSDRDRDVRQDGNGSHPPLLAVTPTTSGAAPLVL